MFTGGTDGHFGLDDPGVVQARFLPPGMTFGYKVVDAGDVDADGWSDVFFSASTEASLFFGGLY
jgi:hypothetical protein